MARQVMLTGIQTKEIISKIKVRKWRLIGQSQINDLDELIRITNYGFYKVDQPGSLLIEGESISLITMDNLSQKELKKSWKFGGRIFIIDQKASGEYLLDLNNPIHKEAARIMLQNTLISEFAGAFNFTKPANVRTVTKKSSKNKLSLRADPIDFMEIIHEVKNKKTGEKEKIVTEYSLNHALSIKVEIDDFNRIMIFLSPMYEVFENKLVPQNRWKLPAEVREKWEKIWRQDGPKLIKTLAPYLQFISEWCTNRKWDTNPLFTFDSSQILQLPNPILVFNNNLIELSADSASDKLIFKSLKKFGHNVEIPNKLTILPVIPDVNKIKVRVPKYFTNWSDAIENAIRHVALRLSNGKYGLAKIPEVEIVEPIIQNGKALDEFFNDARITAERNNIDCIIHVINRFDTSKVGGEHDIAKNKFKQIPSQGVTLRSLLVHPPKGTSIVSFLNTVAPILAMGIMAKFSNRLLWNVKEDEVDLIIGLDVKKIMKGKYAYGIGVTIHGDQIIIDGDGERLNDKTEKIPFKLLYSRILGLFKKVIAQRKEPIKRFLIIRDGFKYSEEIDAIKQVIDKLQLEELVAPDFEFAIIKIIKDLKSNCIRFIDKTTLDDKKIKGQPGRGLAFIKSTKGLSKSAVIVTTGYPDIRVRSSDSNGFSQPLGVDLVYQSENFSLDFKEILRIIYWSTYQNIVSLRQVRVPLVIKLAEAFLEQIITYKLKIKDLPRSIWT